MPGQQPGQQADRTRTDDRHHIAGANRHALEHRMNGHGQRLQQWRHGRIDAGR